MWALWQLVHAHVEPRHSSYCWKEQVLIRLQFPNEYSHWKQFVDELNQVIIKQMIISDSQRSSYLDFELFLFLFF